MYHINHDNMKTDEGAKQELTALIESIDEKDLAESMLAGDIKTVAAFGALVVTGMELGIISTPKEIVMMFGVAFWLGRQAQKEDDKAEDLLKDVKVDHDQH